jgi:hypothetical protein
MPIIRQTPDFHSLPPDGRAVERKEPGFLACQVALEIEAPPDQVMAVLTRAGDYTRWNTTVTKLEGELAQGRTIKLVSVLAPKRTFKLKVSALGPDSMVWEDGMPFGLFRGVRSFRASRSPKGTTVFAMSEIFSGPMLGMIAGSLPDQRATFEAFARDLKREVERST